MNLNAEIYTLLSKEEAKCVYIQAGVKRVFFMHGSWSQLLAKY